MADKILAFDIGGTKIAYALVNEQGQICGEVVKQNTPKTADDIFKLLQNVCQQYANDVVAVAIATAGAVNNANNHIIGSVGNLPRGYENTNFVALSDKLVLVENDANSAAWAEYKLGVAKGLQNVIVLTLGTGVGSGIIVNGALLKGKSGAAGEVHFRMNRGENRQCNCGIKDCFETYVSGSGLAIEAKRCFKNEQANSYDVIKGLAEDNAMAKEAFACWQQSLIDGLVMLGNIFDPDMIVLSGSMAEFVEYAKVEECVNAQIVTSPFKLRLASFKNDAGLLGAALLAWSKK